jgi:hypothetical protein
VSNQPMAWIRRSVFVLGALATVVPCTLAAYAHYLRYRADDLLRISFELAQQRRPPTTQQLRQRFGSAMQESNICTPEGCGYDVLVTNRILAILHLAPYTALESSFWLERDVLQSNDVKFWTRAGGGNGLAVLIRYCDRCRFFRLMPSSDSSTPTAAYVELGTGSSPDHFRTGLALTTGCLTAFDGCATPADVNPGIWQNTSDRTIRCRIPNRDGEVDDGWTRR